MDITVDCFFGPIPASQENEKCSPMFNMAGFLIFLFLDLGKKLIFQGPFNQIRPKDFSLYRPS